MSVCNVDGHTLGFGMVGNQTTVDVCLRYEIQEAGLQYETALGVNQCLDCSGVLPTVGIKEQ